MATPLKDSLEAPAPPQENGTKAAPVDEAPALTEEQAAHPLAALFGKYEGEEWEAVLEAIRRNRRELDAELLD